MVSKKKKVVCGKLVFQINTLKQFQTITSVICHWFYLNNEHLQQTRPIDYGFRLHPPYGNDSETLVTYIRHYNIVRLVQCFFCLFFFYETGELFTKLHFCKQPHIFSDVYFVTWHISTTHTSRDYDTSEANIKRSISSVFSLNYQRAMLTKLIANKRTRWNLGPLSHDSPSMSFLSAEPSSPSWPRSSLEIALTEGAELRSHRPSLMRLQHSGETRWFL